MTARELCKGQARILLLEYSSILVGMLVVKTHLSVHFSVHHLHLTVGSQCDVHTKHAPVNDMKALSQGVSRDTGALQRVFSALTPVVKFDDSDCLTSRRSILDQIKDQVVGCK